MTAKINKLTIMNVNTSSHNNDASLISPPLTPTDTKLPSPALKLATRNHRNKDYIHAYVKMVPQLRLKDSPDNFKLEVWTEKAMAYISTKINKQLILNKPNGRSKKASFIKQKKVVKNISPARSKKEVNSILSGKSKIIRRVSSSATTANQFDLLDINVPDQDFYPLGWKPSETSLDEIPTKVTWKGSPLNIHYLPHFNQLHPAEVSIASTLRLSPIQYIRCKRSLILQAKENKSNGTPFTKSCAQKCCRVDVNKTSALWTAFSKLGWFDGPV